MWGVSQFHSDYADSPHLNKSIGRYDAINVKEEGSMYTYDTGLHTSRVSVLITKMVLVLVSLLIGASCGLYVAAKTLPLPTQETIYVTR